MIILVESKYFDKSIFSEDDLNFFISKYLIDIRGDKFKTKFVGEIITPGETYFSLPKNFSESESNIELFRDVLERFRTSSHIQINSFIPSKSGELKSEKFYFNELLEFFLDYITYGFIYPYKTIKRHTTEPTWGKLDVPSTHRNRKMLGPGVTYNIRDIKNNDSWNLDDIYWSTIKELSQKFGTTNQIEDVNDMFEYLNEEGYDIKSIDISNIESVIDDIENCEVGIIHNPVKVTLLDYYNSLKIGNGFKINIFYTENFQYVWEEMVRKSLRENPKFRDELSGSFSVDRYVSKTKSFKTKELGEDYIKSNKIVKFNFEEKNKWWILKHRIFVKSIPDLFSEYGGKRFIGDAKYYKDPENSHFQKEFETYNNLIDNKYPMVVLVPSNRTGLIDMREEGDLELITLNISVDKIIEDFINDGDRVIKNVQTLIGKYTNRVGNNYLGGF
jgi:hypothetical protein